MRSSPVGARLAEAIPGGKLTAAILENIESGRKGDLNVSQLLNIARALDMPPGYLLAPLGRPEADLDLPNLSDDFSGMTVAGFDAWVSATPAAAYRPRLAAERADIDMVNSLRELQMLVREQERLGVVLEVQSNSGDPDLAAGNASVKARLEATSNELDRIRRVLTSAGWELSR